MKKIFLSLIFMIACTSIFAQTGDVDAIKAKIQKSDADIENPKKNIKSATWDARGNAFIEAYTINTTGLYIGLPQVGTYPSFGADIIVGEPTSKTTNEDGTSTWVYDRINLTFDAEGNLASWKETQIVDENALDKAYAAFTKASELDEKYKSKATTKTSIQLLRDHYLQKGIDSYSNSDLETALTCFEKSLELYDYPRATSDTLFDPGMINFFSGEFASTLNNYEKAKTFYVNAEKLNYEPEKCYHYLATIAKSEGNEKEELRLIEEGYKKYPNSLDILYDLINYYLDKNDTDGALNYINEAIKNDPNNASVHFAKGTLYDKLYSDTTNTDLKQKQEYFDKTVESYKKSAETDLTYFGAYYNLGVLYYMKAKSILDATVDIPSNETARYDAEVANAKEMFKNAKPYMEKAHELDPTDTTVMSTLVTIYGKLQMYTEQKAMKEKLNTLK